MQRRRFLDLTGKSALMISSLHSPLVSSARSQTGRQTGLVVDDGFAIHQISSSHPESRQRYTVLKQAFIDQELLSKTVPITPLKSVDGYLRLIHTEEHIASIESEDAATHTHAALATGGVLAAVDEVCSGRLKNAFCASRPPGHHARNTGQEEGFCYYNHIAIAARYAQQKYRLEKILIVDWDYHHGNGTEASFYADPQVLFFSTHDFRAYPGTGDPNRKGMDAGLGFTINVHLECGAGDEEYRQAFTDQLLPAAEAFGPDLILISAGFDSRVDDRLGCHQVTDQGYAQLTERLMQLAAKHCQGQIISVLEGGYNLEGNAKAAVAHVQALMGA